MNEPKWITRQDLYQEIWRTPINNLAAEWRVSPEAIRRACSRLNVPRPGPGHWLVISRGWNVERTPLEPGGPKTPAETVIGSNIRCGGPIGGAGSSTAEVKVAESLKDLHPLVKVFRVRIEKAKVIAHGPFEVLGEEGDFNVSVSPAQLKRTLLILDALVRELERRGCNFAPPPNAVGPLWIQTPGGTVAFKIWERMTWESVIVRQEPCEGGHINHFEPRYKTTGELTFTLEEDYPRGAQKNWSDAKRTLLEYRLGRIVERVLVCAAEGEVDREREQRQREESRRRLHEEYERTSAPQRLEELRKRIEGQVEQQGQAWVRARGIRDFLTACEAAIKGEAAELPPGSWQVEWLAWSRNFVTRLDPMTNGFFEELQKDFVALKELEGLVARIRREEGASAAKSENR